MEQSDTMTTTISTRPTSEHLRRAIKWAQRATESPEDIGGAHRRYDQRTWDCGTACCLHGAAVLAATGEPADEGPPDPEDYADLDPVPRAAVLMVLCTDRGAPEQLARILDAYSCWPEWSAERRHAVMQRVALDTVRRVLPVALRATGLDDDADRCASAQTLAEAGAAANASLCGHRRGLAADAEATCDAATSARAAARAAAARLEARAAAAAAHAAIAVDDPDAVLAEAVNVWCEAAAG